MKKANPKPTRNHKIKLVDHKMNPDMDHKIRLLKQSPDAGEVTPPAALFEGLWDPQRKSQK